MKTLSITKAGPYGKDQKEDVLIAIEKVLANGLTSKGIDRRLEAEGKELAQLIIANVPGGLAVSLTNELTELLKGLFEDESDFVDASGEPPSQEEGEPADSPGEVCQHKFVLGGIKYETDGVYLAYYHWFFCSRCLQFEYRRFGRQIALLEGVRFDATPK